MSFQPPLPTIAPSLPCSYAWAGWVGIVHIMPRSTRLLPPVPYPPPMGLAGFFMSGCAVCLRFIAVQNPPQRRLCGGQTLCFFSAASPVPAHHLGSAQVNEHVLLHAVPVAAAQRFFLLLRAHKQTRSIYEMEERTPITGPVLQLSGVGVPVWITIVLGVGAPLRHAFCDAAPQPGPMPCVG